MEKKESIKDKKFKKLTLEVLVRIFYAYDISGRDILQVAQDFIKERYIPESYVNLIMDTVNFYIENRINIDNMIESHLEGWRFERIGYIERAVLRVGVCRLLMLSKKREISYTISFLLEILECYTDSKHSVKFVNGVIGRILRENLKGVKS